MPTTLAIEAFLQAHGVLIDVRTPAEFAQGHLPGARNLPLFSDDERAEVGTLYKHSGRQAAVQRGLALVGPRLAQLAEALLAAHNQGAEWPLRVHCWRGGLRSASVAWLASTMDLPVVLLEGGYKAYRRWVLALLETPWPLRLLGGRTGAGKTELLAALAGKGVAVVDLEGLAHHRGSSFGGLGLPPQPSSEQFENLLAQALDGLRGAEQIWLEAESAQVGRCRIPAGLWRQMKAAPLLEVRRPVPERLRHLVAIYGDQDPNALVEATQRISKRLGPQRTAAAVEAIRQGEMAQACAQMLDYYDRCYDADTAAHRATAVDLGERSPEESAELLLREGLVRAASR
ncbi:MAG: tRNA 2-selenouridine(34) synthase MnmH [Cyanobacteriota bacterium]|nr:tRNA 2-selenouridine(34) synthase MnmH [Cyanobacteriota bacterium]